MSATTSSTALTALLAALALCGPSCSPHAKVPERPNLLLISVDCLRADHLSCYGYARPTSPAIDALAREGVRFERALSASGWTLPSHLSMLSGMPLSAHGVEDERLWQRVDASGKPLPVNLRAVFAPELLHDAGYATAGFYTVGWLDPRYGFGAGFDTWERWGHTFFSHPVVGPLYQKVKAAADVQGLNELRKTYPELFDTARRSSPETVDRAIGWMEEHQRTASGQPFLVFMHLFDAHEPYSPPAPYAKLFEAAAESGAAGPAMAKYDACIRGIDAELARLFARLEALGLAKNTLVVLTGDHGEEFDEHGNRSHRIQLFLENIHVPLLMRWPEGLPAGKVVRGNAGHIDIAATLYAAAGVRKPAFVLGTNLLPIARGEEPNAQRTYVSELAVFRDGIVPQRHLTILRGDELRVLHCRGRAPWSGVRFDLARNPEGRGAGETLALEGSEGKRLDKELAELRASFQRARALAPLRAGAAKPLSRQEREEIEALGYTGSDEQIRGHDSGERLFLDGGVWPDE